MKKYNSLYREYRPQIFDDVIGQDHIVRTLINQIKSDRVSHAYLFCGTRGTGKTSVAKIFARAVNCLKPKNGSPCGKCKVCKAYHSQSTFDIIEIDAASNNSVEQAKDIIEAVNFPPRFGRYKVYIIDEVHMLSTNAFNALLKTLEEPPAHAVFILATTEMHKLPATILSRCMRFDFKLVRTKVIKEHLKKILRKEKVRFEDEAITILAEAGKGSVRDALTITDTVVSFSDGNIKYEDITEFLGIADPLKIFNIVKYLLQGDLGGMLRTYSELVNVGKNIKALHGEIINMLSKFIYVKNCTDAKEGKGIQDDLYEKITAASIEFENQDIIKAIDVLSRIEGDMRYSQQPEIVLESALMRAASRTANLDLDGVLFRVKALEEKLKNNQVIVQASEQTTEKVGLKLNGQTFWAKLCKWLKQAGHLQLYAVATKIKPENIEYDNTILNVETENKSEYNLLTTRQNKKCITNYFNKNETLVKDVKFLYKKSADEQYREEVKKVKNTLGD